MEKKRRDVKGVLAIFVKTPSLSPVKTRLAADIGNVESETFYKLSVRAIEEIAMTAKSQSNDELTPYWAIAEREGLKDPLWQDFELLWTGEGGLGERLHHVYSHLLKKYDYVIIIGSDSPQLSPEVILDAAKLLRCREKRCVIGPCTDGGFYLFGCADRVEAVVWTQIKYSQPTTLTELRKKLNPHNIYMLPVEQDVDVVGDLHRLYRLLLQREECLLPEQRQLLEWLKLS